MKAILTLDFQSYWQAGTGDSSAGADLDEIFDRDEDGLPLLRGRRLKGLIKDAARLHQDCGQSAPLTLEEAFGKEGGYKASTGGLLDIRNARVSEPERSQLLARKHEFGGLSESLAATAIENKDNGEVARGIARNKSLRRIEAAIPMKLHATIEWPDGAAASLNRPEATSDKIRDWLQKVLRLLRYAGRHRHRGFGRCHAMLDDYKGEEIPGDEKQTSPSAPVPAGTTQCLTLRLTLKDSVIISARAASTGPHETLDYIAGSALWGATSPLYGRWAKNDEWEKIQAVFHCGQVRFLPGLPEGTGNESTLPAPLAWHFRKGAKFNRNGKLVKDDEVKLTSLCAAEWDFAKDNQPQQVRGGWFSPDGSYRTVKREFQAKTAVDPKNFDRAEDSQFFGYTAIAPGQTFIARIEVDEKTPEWDEVVEFFKGKKELRIGRSKTAEYGRASVEITDDSAWTKPAASPSAPPDQIIFHALSDLALVNENGQPTLAPESSTFGLTKDWVLDEDHTYTQIRTYSLWNRFRGSHDAERQVLKAGSVIAFKRNGTPPATPLDIASLPHRVGVWQEQGLGVVAVNPHYLFEVPAVVPKPETTPAGSTKNAAPAKAPDADTSPLVKAMHRRFCRHSLQRLAVALGRKWSKNWHKGGLSTSQWTRLREAAVNATSRDQLVSALNNDATGLFKHGRSAEKWDNEHEPVTPAKQVIKSLSDDSALKAELTAGGVPDTTENISTLALAACREAAIACARAKQKN